MLSDDRKASVDILSDDDLAYEINRGTASRFQGELFAYARTRLDERKRLKDLRERMSTADTVCATAAPESDLKVRRSEKWTRTDMLTAWSIIVAITFGVVALASSVTIPELRRAFDLRDPPATGGQSGAASAADFGAGRTSIAVSEAPTAKAITPAPALEASSSVPPVAASKPPSEPRGTSPLLSAEIKRRKEPLEAIPLDEMKIRGVVINGARPYVLVVAGNLLYQVKEGDHLGYNFGKVTKISVDEVWLREVVKDSQGEWVEHTKVLKIPNR